MISNHYCINKIRSQPEMICLVSPKGACQRSVKTMINEASAREARKKPVVRESTSGTAQLFRRTKRYKPLAFLYHTGASTPSRLRTLAENQLRNVKIEAPPRKKNWHVRPNGREGPKSNDR